MTFVPAADRYEGCRTSAAVAAAFGYRPCRSACGTTSATNGRLTPSGRSCAARSTSVSRISIWRTTTGPPFGSAEENFGKLLGEDPRPVSGTSSSSRPRPGTTCGQGLTASGGSRKYLLASLDQSLRRMGLDYVDVFYSHRFDPETPLEETMGALDSAVRQGKALYVGISSYSCREDAGGGCDPPRPGHPAPDPSAAYSMLNRWIEDGLLDVLGELGVGCIAFSPLAQGMLTDKYLQRHPGGLACD